MLFGLTRVTHGSALLSVHPVIADLPSRSRSTSGHSGNYSGDLRLPQKAEIDGPLFLGMDTHALSEPAFASALEVLAANHVEVMISEGSAYTPTPAVSHAIMLTTAGNRRDSLTAS